MLQAFYTKQADSSNLLITDLLGEVLVHQHLEAHLGEEILELLAVDVGAVAVRLDAVELYVAEDHEQAALAPARPVQRDACHIWAVLSGGVDGEQDYGSHGATI